MADKTLQLTSVGGNFAIKRIDGRGTSFVKSLTGGALSEVQAAIGIGDRPHATAEFRKLALGIVPPRDNDTVVSAPTHTDGGVDIRQNPTSMPGETWVDGENWLK